jgi:YggT family protein
MSGLISVGYFLFSLLFSLVIFMLWARMALRYFRVSSLHPISQTINKFVTPLLKPFDYILPISKKRLSRYDWACFTLLVVVEFLKYILLSLLVLGSLMPMLYLLLYVGADLIIQPCNLLFYAILIRVIMSWINPMQQYALSDILHMLTEPALSIARRGVPTISGFDFSPFLVMIVLKVITIFISASLPVQLG